MTTNYRLPISISLFVALLVFNSCTKSKDNSKPTNELSFALTDDAKSLDPAIAYDTVGMDVIPLGVESLYQYKYTTMPLELDPLLAENLPEFSQDGLSAKIRIKKGVLWQDDAVFPNGKGRELIANDFVYAWKRICLPVLQSPGAWIYNDRVKGWNEYCKKMADHPAPESLLSQNVPGFEVLDNYTIRIHLTQKYQQLPHVLTMAYSSPVPHEFVEKHGQLGFNNTFIGTGPFRLKEYVRGSHFVLEKNPSFRGESFPATGDENAQKDGLLNSAGLALPFVEKITFKIFREDQPRFLQFMKGDLDVSGIPKDNFTSMIENGNLRAEMAQKGIQFLKLEQASLYFIAFNMKDPVVGGNNNALRKAIGQAFNRDEFLEIFRNGRGIKADSIVPRVLPGYQKGDFLLDDFNLESAKKTLATAGYGSSKVIPKIRFDLRGTSANHRLQAEFLQRSLAKIGIELEILQNTFPAYLEKERNGNLQMVLGVWDTDYPDAQAIFSALYGKNVSPGPNIANYQNKKFDLLYEKIANMPEGPNRSALIKQMELLVFQDAPWIPLFYPQAFSLGHGWVKNFRPNIQITNHMKYFAVDLEKKAKLKDLL